MGLPTTLSDLYSYFCIIFSTVGIKGRTTYQHILYQRTMEAEAAERKETDLEMQQDINDQTSTSTGCFVSLSKKYFTQIFMIFDFIHRPTQIFLSRFNFGAPL